MPMGCIRGRSELDRFDNEDQDENEEDKGRAFETGFALIV